MCYQCFFVTLQHKTNETNEKNFSITFIGRGHNDDGADDSHDGDWGQTNA